MGIDGSIDGLCLDRFDSGACFAVLLGGLVAAPTTSSPERIGGVRNWDYR